MDCVDSLKETEVYKAYKPTVLQRDAVDAETCHSTCKRLTEARNAKKLVRAQRKTHAWGKTCQSGKPSHVLAYTGWYPACFVIDKYP